MLVEELIEWETSSFLIIWRQPCESPVFNIVYSEVGRENSDLVGFGGAKQRFCSSLAVGLRLAARWCRWVSI